MRHTLSAEFNRKPKIAVDNASNKQYLNPVCFNNQNFAKIHDEQ